MRCLPAGSLACAVYGLPGAVQDVNAFANVHQEQLPSLRRHLSAQYLVDPGVAARQPACFSCLYVSHIINIDLLLSSNLFKTFLLRRGRTLALLEGKAPFQMACAEDLTVMSLSWYQQQQRNCDDSWNNLPGLLDNVSLAKGGRGEEERG